MSIIASKELLSAIENYEQYIARKGNCEQAVDAYVEACKTAFLAEKDIQYGLIISERCKGLIHDLIRIGTEGGDFKFLEEWSQKNKQEVKLINQYYEILLLEAPYKLDSFALYIEKNKLRKERLYEPRRKTLIRVTNALQRLEDDEMDELFVHMPARVGKTLEMTFGVAWHCARYTEGSNLYVSFKEGLGEAFLDGVIEIYRDPTYCFADVFPNVKIVDTDAKNHKMDLNRVKKYKSLSGKGMESGLNGEYDAYGWLICDDLYEGIQEVLSPEIRKRKQTIFNNNVIKRAKENCKKIWNGTIWSTEDIFMNRQKFLAENPEAKDIRYEIIKIPALDPETDESNFDYDYGVGFSTKHYRIERAKFEEDDDMASFYAQDQQEPIERDGAVFNANTMNYYSVLPEIKPLKIIAHGDVALGGGDYVSFPVIYCYEDGRMYCEDVVFDNSEKHITQPQIITLIKKHGLKNVHFESNQGGEGYKDDIKRMLLEDKEFNNGRPINITSDWAPSTLSKQQRIWDNAQAIRQIYFKDPQHRHAQYKKFMQNLFKFRMNMKKKENDDAPDSLAGAIDFDLHGSGISVAKIIASPI